MLIVSDGTEGPLFAGDFLYQPEIRILRSLPDRGAFEIARSERPSLIVEELEPPGHEGLALCRDLARDTATRAIPLILITPDEMWEAAHSTRADIVLGKPVTARELFDAVRRFIPLPTRRTRRVKINLRFTFEIDGHRAQAFCRDLSIRGAFLKTDRRLPLGTRLALGFRIPGIDREVRCRGIIRTSTTAASGTEAGGVGLEFVDLSEDDRAHLTAFLGQQG